MLKTSLLRFGFLVTVFFTVYFTACKKATVDPPASTCAGKTIVVAATTTATSSPTATNGAIAASATGSTGFTFSKDGTTFQASGNFTNLAAGSYTITAKDDAGCTGSKAFVVSATACPTIVVTGTTTPASSAGASNGAINASATGSTGITYSKDGTNFQASGVFTGLPVASYTITAKDLNGCLGTAAFTISAASCPTITVTGIVTPATGPANANGSITASASGGATPYEYSRNGTTFQNSGVFGSLSPGSYTITAKDANGCLGSAIINVGNSCPVITLSTATTGTDKCLAPATGSITLTTPTTGTAPFTYNLNAGTFQSSTLFNGLSAASYNMIAKDANGCTSAATVATVAVLPAGPNFTSVKAILAANCAFAGCHGGATPQSGINFADDCTIVAQRARIKARAVDATPSVMPPAGAISNADKQKITDWINAGGGHSN